MGNIYMIHVEGDSSPQQVFLDYERAMARAKYLAQSERSRVIVLRTVAIVTAVVPEGSVTYSVEII